jgi:general secretion pathway protein A
MAGALRQDIFQRNAIESIHEYSGGIPRLINILCDTALVYGFADSLETIGRKVVEDVINAREAGGMFSIDSPRDQSGPITVSTEIEVKEHSDTRLKLMEQRIGTFEILVKDLNRRLDRLSRKKDQRDDMILELFKMLKDSMESRRDALAQLKQSGNIAKTPQPKPNESKKEHRPPFSLRLKRKK